MLRKIIRIIRNFIRTLEKSELVEIFFFPIIATVFIYFLCNTSLINFDGGINKFISEFNNIVISTTSIISAFGMGSLGMIVASSSPNIEAAKDYMTEKVGVNGICLSYYKIQILRHFFSLFVLFLLLIYSICMLFIQILKINIMPLLYIEIFLLFLALISQVFVIQGIYFLFIDPKRNY